MRLSSNTEAEDYIHYSEVSTLASCKLKHKYSYIDRVEPVRGATRMHFGSFGHAALADLWLGTTEHFARCLELISHEFISPEEELEIRLLANTAKGVATRVHRALARSYEVYEGHVERTLRVQPPGLMAFGGTPDVIVRDKGDASIWILDYKFRSTFKPPESEWLNLQMIAYQWLAVENDIPVLGTRQVQIRPHLPKEPVRNKDGGMSRRDLQTDWTTYELALLKAGLKPEDYSEMMQKLAEKKFWDFEACKAIRRQEELAFFVEHDLLPLIKEAAENRRNPQRGGRCFNDLICSWCGYRELCVAEARNEDADYIRESLYRIKGTKESFPVLEEDVE